MPSRRRMENPLALAVLALLAERAMHPYEMAALMRERAWDTSIKLNYGALYTVVEALRRRGWIKPQETVREGRRPQRTVYALTDGGRAELHDWLRELLGRPAPEFTQFAAGLTLIAHFGPAEAAALLEERARHLEAEVGRGRGALGATVDQGLPRLLILEHEHSLVLREAELAWVRRLAGEIRDGTLPWPG